MRWRVSRLAMHAPNARRRTMRTGSQMVEHQRRAGKQKEPQVIPAAAVEAAHKAWREQAAKEGSIFEYNLRAALEAAAPHMPGEVERELAEAKRVIALLVLEAGGKVALSSRAITEISDETIIETTQDVINGGWVIRAVRRDDAR